MKVKLMLIAVTALAVTCLLSACAMPYASPREENGIATGLFRVEPLSATESDPTDGTLQYTPSEDGQTVTISYEWDGEMRSYTVPNNDNYLFGGYAATDDLNRSLYTSDEVGVYGDKGERYVGLFYFLWHGQHGDDGLYDLQKILDDLGPVGAQTAYDRYGPLGTMHWFSEPLYGYYYANDAWVLRKHAELLTMANVDFLYLDVTNGYPYVENAITLMSILHELNEQGFDAPEVVFYTHTKAENVVNRLYSDIYAQNLYPDTWFYVNGKPVIIAPESANINDFFTVKYALWPTESPLRNAWPWMDFEWPTRLYPSTTGYDGSAINVSIAQHSGTVAFSDSALYGNYTNRGRSFRFSSTRVTDAQLRNSYQQWLADPDSTYQGLNFQAQFDRAIKSKAMYILVTGWNEWVAQRQPSSTSIRFVDAASMEFSRDAEMMRGGYFDNYYIQLIYNIQRAKGTAPVIVQDARKTVRIDGGFEQWNDVAVTYTDVTGDTVDRNATGFGKQTYTNTSGRNDIQCAKVTSDAENLYFYVRTVDDITPPDRGSSWMKLYLNVDAQGDRSTGWYGYDFIVNHTPTSATSTTVAAYSGTDGAYGFTDAAEIPYRIEGNEMMLAVPLSALDIEDPSEISLTFKWADSETVYDEMEDLYCDGDAAPLGRLNYIYQNYIPTPQTDTSDTTTAEDDDTAEPDGGSSEESTTRPAVKPLVSCATALTSSAALIALPLLAAACLLRKKEN